VKLTKSSLIGCLILLISLGLSHRAFADLAGSDDFNGASVDPTKWGSDIDSGVGIFTQTNGHLLFTTSGTPTSNDQAIHPWILNQGSFTQDWSMQLDVNLPTQTLTGTQVLSIGLAAVNASNMQDDMTMSLQQDVPNGTLYYSGFDINGTAQSPTEQGGLSGGLVSLQLSYSAAGHSITAYYDANGPTGGYTWTPFVTQDISSWGMTSSDQFLVAITAFSANNLAVPSTSQVWADNFQVPASVPEPSSWILFSAGFLGLMGIMRHRSPVRARSAFCANEK
jgi:hypothetical protein